MKKLFRKLFPNKEQRAYHKMHRRHRKELIKHAKETGEWDWGWLHDSIIMQIRHMHEYYTAGNNVWQTDETRLPIIEQLKHILDMAEEIDNFYNNNDVRDFEGFEQFEAKEQALYDELYSSIGRDLRYWWD